MSLILLKCLLHQVEVIKNFQSHFSKVAKRVDCVVTLIMLLATLCMCNIQIPFCHHPQFLHEGSYVLT